MAQTVSIDGASWQSSVLESELPVMVDFGAEWCGPCKMIAPSVEELALEYAGRLTIAKLDVDTNPQIAARYGVRSIPTLILFRGGNPVNQMVGAQPKGKMRRTIDEVLQG